MITDEQMGETIARWADTDPNKLLALGIASLRMAINNLEMPAGGCPEMLAAQQYIGALDRIKREQASGMIPLTGENDVQEED